MQLNQHTLVKNFRLSGALKGRALYGRNDAAGDQFSGNVWFEGRPQAYAVKIATSPRAGLFTQDTHRGTAVVQRLQIGNAHINDPTGGNETHMPFGDAKTGGFRRFGGSAVVYEFAELRCIAFEDPRSPIQSKMHR